MACATSHALEEVTVPWGSLTVPSHIPRDFSLGVVVAPTAGGKTAAMVALQSWGLEQTDAPEFGVNDAVIAHPALGTPAEAASRLSAAGLGAVPTWCRPWRVLSHGERSRVTIALRLRDRALLDDIGAFVTKDQARGIAAGISRYVRSHGLHQVVVATVHEEVVPWFAPDWTWWPSSHDSRVVLHEHGPTAGLGARFVEEVSCPTKAIIDEAEGWESEPCDSVSISCNVDPHPALHQVAQMFDYNAKVQSVRLPVLPARVFTDDFRVGVVLGPSGSGKTTALRAFGVELALEWPEPGSETVCPDEALPTLAAQLGLNSDSFKRPLTEVSAGEAHLCQVARAMMNARELAVVDELGSRLDPLARKRLCQGVRSLLHSQAGGCAHRLVVATVHSDVVKPLEADWVFDTEASLLWWRNMGPTCSDGADATDVPGDAGLRPSLLPSLISRPLVEILVCKLSSANVAREWRRFSRHHYLREDLSPAAESFVAWWDGQRVAFVAVLPREARHSCAEVREHRLVVLPDFQGLGIGLAVSEALAERGLRHGLLGSKPPVRYFSSTAHSHLGRARDKSGRWDATPFSGTQAARPGDNRILFKHVFVGSGDRIGGSIQEGRVQTLQRGRGKTSVNRQRATKNIDPGEVPLAVNPPLSVDLLHDPRRLAYWATVSAGLEDVVADEARKKFEGIVAEVKVNTGRVDLRIQRTVQFGHLLAPERVYLQLISASPIPSGEKGLQTLGELATRSDVAGVVTSAAQLMGKPSRPYFRVTCRRSGTKSFGTDAAAAAIASGLEALHWQPDLQRFDTEILAWIHSDRLLLGLSVSARGVVGGAHLLVPGRQVSTSPLRPHIAYAMLVKCAGSSTDSGVVLDPMCGSNVIAELATGSEMAPRLFCLSGDFGESAIVSARNNAEKLLCSRRARIDIVRWDARRLPLRRFSVDWVVVHPPGVRFFGPRHLAELYESAFSECRRVLRPRRREKGSSSVTAALLVNRKLAAGPLSGMVAGDAGCGLQGGAVGIAWVRHGEVRLPHEGDSALVSLETRVKPVPKVKLRAADSKQE